MKKTSFALLFATTLASCGQAPAFQVAKNDVQGVLIITANQDVMVNKIDFDNPNCAPIENMQFFQYQTMRFTVQRKQFSKEEQEQDSKDLKGTFLKPKEADFLAMMLQFTTPCKYNELNLHGYWGVATYSFGGNE